MGNTNLNAAKTAKNDEFYTLFEDIEKEMNAYLEFDPDVFKDKTILLPCDDPEWSNFTKYFAQNFDRFGLKKLVSTSYAPNSKPEDIPYQPTLFELEGSDFSEEKTRERGKIFTLVRDRNGDKKINLNDLEWSYLEGDGDFRSDEVTRLRDEADFVITNPPFSLFREFVPWLLAGTAQFSVIGDLNAISAAEIFTPLKEGLFWVGVTRTGTGQMFFEIYEGAPVKTGQVEIDGKRYQTIGSSAWFTNIEHGIRRRPLRLATMQDNLKFSKDKKLKEMGYAPLDNYDAIGVPRVELIPSDYDGPMAVPISFLGKFNPSQFEILDANNFRLPHFKKTKPHGLIKDADSSIGGKATYQRMLIRRIQS